MTRKKHYPLYLFTSCKLNTMVCHYVRLRLNSFNGAVRVQHTRFPIVLLVYQFNKVHNPVRTDQGGKNTLHNYTM